MPFCCHGYTKAVTQDLMDTFKAKSQKKGNRLRQQEEEEEDEEDVVDEVTLLVTDSRSLFSGLYSWMQHTVVVNISCFIVQIHTSKILYGSYELILCIILSTSIAADSCQNGASADQYLMTVVGSDALE